MPHLLHLNTIELMKDTSSVLLRERPVAEAPHQRAPESAAAPDSTPVPLIEPEAARREVGWGQVLRRFASGWLVLSLGIILAYHFYLFWTVGSVMIWEPNKLILSLESVMSVGIIGFGLELVLRD